MVGVKNQEFFYSTFPTVHNWGEDYLYQFQGFWFLPSFIHGSKQVVDHFQPLSTDVILASSPKTGTTWLKSLLYSIVNRPSKSQLLTTSHPHEIVPSLELQVYGEPLSDSSPPCFPSNTASSTRLLSTHLPYQMLGESLNSSDCRVVYVARNPKDTVVSLWHFENLISLENREPRPLEDVVSKFCAGTVIYGPYYEHVLMYHKESLERPEKFFFVTYEELKSDPKTHVKRLAEFLGCPFEGVDDMDEQVDEVVRSCSVENLKKHEVNNSTDVPSWGMMPYKSYFRKGQVGDHANYLTEDMINRIDAITRIKFHGVNLWGEN